MEKFLTKIREEVNVVIENYDDSKLDELYKKLFIINTLTNIELQEAQTEMYNTMSSISKNSDFSNFDFNSIIDILKNEGE